MSILNSVDAIFVDPGRVDLDHSLNDAWVFGEHIIEAPEIAHGARFASERRVASVVIVDWVIEPRRSFDILFGRIDLDRVCVIGVLQPRKICSRSVALTRKPRIDRAAVHSAAALVRIVRDASVRTVAFAFTFRKMDDVGRMVYDDIHVDLHSALVRSINEGLEVAICSEMRVDGRKIGNPISMISGALMAGEALDRLVLEDRREPDCGRAKILDVTQSAGQTLKVAPMIVTLVGRIEACDAPIARKTAPIVGGIAVLETVGHDEVYDFVLRKPGAELRQICTGNRLRGDGLHRHDCQTEHNERVPR